MDQLDNCCRVEINEYCIYLPDIRYTLMLRFVGLCAICNFKSTCIVMMAGTDIGFMCKSHLALLLIRAQYDDPQTHNYIHIMGIIIEDTTIAIPFLSRDQYPMMRYQMRNLLKSNGAISLLMIGEFAARCGCRDIAHSIMSMYIQWYLCCLRK